MVSAPGPRLPHPPPSSAGPARSVSAGCGRPRRVSGETVGTGGAGTCAAGGRPWAPPEPPFLTKFHSVTRLIAAHRRSSLAPNSRQHRCLGLSRARVAAGSTSWPCFLSFGVGSGALRRAEPCVPGIGSGSGGRQSVGMITEASAFLGCSEY